MLELLTNEPLKQIAIQGTGWLLFVVALGVIAYLHKRLEKQTVDSSDAVKVQYEKRLTEGRETFDSLNRNTAAMGVLSASIEARTLSVNSLTGAFADLAKDLESSRTLWDERLSNLQKEIGNINTRMEVIQYGKGGSRP